MTALTSALADYLTLRRALGHKLDDASRHLARFVAYLDQAGAETVTLEATLAFVLDPDINQATSTPTRRLIAVRGFAKHLSGTDPRTEIAPAGIVSFRHRRRNPFIYTENDIEAVTASARALTPFPFRGATLATLIGLLAVTGMRVGEAIRLDRTDINWNDAVIAVRDTKFGKSRDVPVSATTIDALGTYARQRDRRNADTPAFFVSLAGSRLIYTNFCLTFNKAVVDSGIAAASPIRPTIHDLRHSFATTTLLRWHQDGLDVGALLPRLSTYLGHREPRCTYGYLSAVPELLRHAAVLLETHQPVIS